MGNRNLQSCVDLIKTALSEKRRLTFAYIAHHGNKTARTVEPYQLVLKSSHWYLHGYCQEKKRLSLIQTIPNFRLTNAGGNLYAARLSKNRI